MRYEIQYQPSYALAIVHLDTGERFRAEAGAMVTMDESIRIETKTGGGLGSVLRRSVLGGETLFVNDMVATRDDSRLTLAPALPGDIVGLELGAGQELFVQSGSYMASSPEVVVDTKFGAGKSFFSGEGLFLLKLTGPGTVLLSSYGAIAPIELAAGETHMVDTGHMVAFDATMGYEVKKAGNSWKTTLLGGEGLVVRISGPGRFYFQTRSPGGLLDWLIPRIPQRSN
ncbi:MAG TPA: TIGR00266 family protein [Candidatus Limnocylindrales bacterium]|nr:TIGR00266 family protein [Candidatus Limnocylindrales bacterium]